MDQLNLFPDVVVVSGASRGIGRKLVNLLLGSGFDVVTLSRQACNSPRISLRWALTSVTRHGCRGAEGCPRWRAGGGTCEWGWSS